MLRKPKREVVKAKPQTPTREVSAIDLHLQSVALSGEYGPDVVQFYHDSVASYETGDDYRQWLRGLTTYPDAGEPNDKNGLSEAEIAFVLAGRSSSTIPRRSDTDRLGFISTNHKTDTIGARFQLPWPRDPETLAEWEAAYRSEKRPRWQWSQRYKLSYTWGDRYTADGRLEGGKDRITNIMARVALELDQAPLASLLASELEPLRERVELYFDAYNSANHAGESVLQTYRDLPDTLHEDPALLASFMVRQIAETNVADPVKLADEVEVFAHDERYFPRYKTFRPKGCKLLFDTGVALARAGLPAEGRAFIQRNLGIISEYYHDYLSDERSFTPDVLALYDFQTKVARVVREGLSSKEYRSLLQQAQKRFSPHAIILLALDGAEDTVKDNYSVNSPKLLQKAFGEVASYRKKDYYGEVHIESIREFQQYTAEALATYFPLTELDNTSSYKDRIAAYMAAGRQKDARDLYLRVRSNDRIESLKKLGAAAAMVSWHGSSNETIVATSSLGARVELLQAELAVITKPAGAVEASGMWQRYDKAIRALEKEVVDTPDRLERDVLAQHLQTVRMQLDSLC